MERWLGFVADVSLLVVLVGVMVGVFLGIAVGATGAVHGFPLIFWGGCGAAVSLGALRLTAHRKTGRQG